MNQNNPSNVDFSRRRFLRESALGFGSLALSGLCAEQAFSNGLALKPQHFTPRAKRIIFLHMQGGQSQMDLYDPKPKLNGLDGKPVDSKRLSDQGGHGGKKYKGSPFSFSTHGKSGVHLSELVPHLGKHADDICLIRSMHTDTANHSNAMLLFHTGAQNFIRPSLGSWVLYGLGAENNSLPGFITIRPSTNDGSRLYSNAFLPARYQAATLGNSRVPASKATFRHLKSAQWSPEQQKAQLGLTQSLNRSFLDKTATTPELEGVIQSYELAFRMQTEAPELFDFSDEPQSILDMYGVDQKETDAVARMCLMARRFAEAGVRFIQVNHTGWDHHGGIDKSIPRTSRSMDQPTAALLQDLKQRGLLDETLVISAGEFGRTTTGEGKEERLGRGHNAKAFTIWMAGGGVRGGLEYGLTDELGHTAIENRVHVHDLHATMLHLLGLDHERLTYRYAGRDFRLTDVYGNVVHDIIA